MFVQILLFFLTFLAILTKLTFLTTETGTHQTPPPWKTKCGAITEWRAPRRFTLPTTVQCISTFPVRARRCGSACGKDTAQPWWRSPMCRM